MVSEAHVKALGEMDDANQELNHSWETLQHSVLAELAPVLTDATSALADLLNQFNDWVETDEGKEAMSDLSTSLRELFSGITDVKFSDAIDAAKTGLNALRSGLAWLRDNKDGVYTGLKVIAGAEVKNNPFVPEAACGVDEVDEKLLQLVRDVVQL